MTPEGHPEKFNIGTPWHTNEAFEAAMKYRSPIEIIQGELETKIENDIMTAVQRYDIRVDKDELIKALQYDRKQYEQGYNDARADYMKPNEAWVGSKSNASRIICTGCGMSVDYTKIDFVLKYCPNCGAIMNRAPVRPYRREEQE